MYEDCIERFSCNRAPDRCSPACYRTTCKTHKKVTKVTKHKEHCGSNPIANIRYVEGPQGRPGVGMQFEWEGSVLKTKLETDKNWTFSQSLLGPQGAKGEKGDTGEKGEKGDTGLQGIQGPIGPQGYTPYVGENGNWHINGEDLGINAYSQIVIETAKDSEKLGGQEPEYYATMEQMNNVVNQIDNVVSETLDNYTPLIKGENLIINSHLLKLTGTDQSENYAAGVTTIENGAVKLVPAKDGNMYLIGIPLTEILKVGETYTFSVDILTTNDVGFQCTIGKYFEVYTKASSEWQRISTTFVQTKETNNCTLQIATVKAGQTYYYKNFKLEKSKVATDWVPTNKDSISVTIPATGWSATAPFTIDVTAYGITAKDKPKISPVLSSTLATAQAQLEAWNCIDSIVTGADKITCTCYLATPNTAIPIVIS